jgi:hypothetical protein
MVIKSSNWAGYGLLGGQYTDVSAEWTQPEVDCTAGESEVGFWVGLDGVDTDKVEQIGTAASCLSKHDGSAEHYAWVEVYPTPQSFIYTVDVHPGDHFTASVHAVTEQLYLMKLENTTTGQSFSMSLQRTGDWPSSAEWIVEPTTICKSSCDIATLAHFDDVTFTNVFAGAADGPLALAADSGLVQFDVRSSDGRLADVSPLALDDPSFDVSWRPISR